MGESVPPILLIDFKVWDRLFWGARRKGGGKVAGRPRKRSRVEEEGQTGSEQQSGREHVGGS